LRAGRLAAVEADGEAHHERAYAVRVDLGEDLRGISLEALSANGAQGCRDDEQRVGERQSHGLGADVEAQQPRAFRKDLLEVAGVADRHDGC